MIKELIEKIRLQFNSDERIEAMLQSYNLKPRDGTVEIDPFELLREELFIDLISNNHPKSLVLDVGCGFGHMVLNLQKAGIECKGIDISSSLISLGKELLISEGIDPNKLLEADLFEYDFKEKFCTIAACGVIWYYSDKRPFLKKLHSLLESSGKTVITHRNDLFNLFALNAGTSNFFKENLFSAMNSKQINELQIKMSKEVPELSTAIQQHVSSKLDKKYENPFTIHELYEECGFKIEQICYTYIHPSPPRFKLTHSAEDYKKAQLEFGKSWQGMLAGSQFVVVAQKI